MHASEFGALVPECCSEVLDSMYFVSVMSAFIKPGPVSKRRAEDIAFTLDYAGDFAGQFGVSVAAGVARTLAANFLGEDESVVTETQVTDVIGELSNMLCGSIVSRAARHTKFALSHPRPASDITLPGSLNTLEVELETDLGNVSIWMSVEGVACPS